MSFIILNFVIKVNIKYYPETLLEEWNDEIKNNKKENLVNDDLDLNSSDEADNESDNESNDDGVNDQFEK